MHRLYSADELAAQAVYIEKLLSQFPQEAKPFFDTLHRSERDQLRRYLALRKADNWVDWSFAEGTYQTVAQINQKAQHFYETHLRYQQLDLNLFANLKERH